MIDRAFQLDRDKATAIVAEWLGDRPALADILGARAQDANGLWRLTWPLHAAIDERGWVLLSIQAPSGTWILAWHGPREYVELVDAASLN